MEKSKLGGELTNKERRGISASFGGCDLMKVTKQDS